MSDTARDYQTIDSAATDGMEDLFDVVPTSADSLNQDADIVATVNDSGSWVPVIEAASSMRKSERTIQRYAKCGKLQAKTDKYGRLLIWLATSANTPVSLTDYVATSADSNAGLATNVGSVATLVDNNPNLITTTDNKHLWDLLKEKDAKIEALLMRNGYLQAQAESAQETIKLLTDSQHKPSWWAKFSSWFFKGQ
jgi:hypothetical protein